MNEQTSEYSMKLWKTLVETHLDYSRAQIAFLSDDVDRVEPIRMALRSKDRHTAIIILPYLKDSELQAIFPELIFQVSFGHGAIQRVRDAIKSIPRAWVLKRIEATVEPFLQNGTYEEYQRFLELYDELDEDLTQKLAKRALKHEDEDIREAGEDFLEL